MLKSFYSNGLSTCFDLSENGDLIGIVKFESLRPIYDVFGYYHVTDTCVMISFILENDRDVDSYTVFCGTITSANNGTEVLELKRMRISTGVAASKTDVDFLTSDYTIVDFADQEEPPLTPMEFVRWN